MNNRGRAGHRPVRVVVAGCGFAGSSAVKTLADDATRQQVEIIAIDKQAGLYNYPVLPRLLVETVPSTRVEIPYERLLSGAVVRRERIKMIDVASRLVCTESAQYDYDFLILSLGSRALPLTQDPGVFVFYPKSSRHLEKLSETITKTAQRMAQTPVSNNAQRYRIAVVGGGLTGVEFAGALREAADRACLRYSVRRDCFEVAIYERSSQLNAQGANVGLSKTLHRELTAYRVGVVTNCNVHHVKHNKITTSTGSYPAECVVCCGGAKTNLRWELNGMSVETNGFTVDSFLRSPDYPNIFPVGDGMLFRDATGTPSLGLRKAYRALVQGKIAARNVMRSIDGRPLRSYRPKHMPTLVMINSRQGVLSYRDWVVSGSLIGWLKRWLEVRHAA